MKKTIFALLALASIAFAQPITVNKAGHHNVATVPEWSNSFFNVIVKGNSSQTIYGRAHFGSGVAYAYWWSSAAARDAGDTSAVTVVAGVRGIVESGVDAVVTALPRNSSGDTISFQFQKLPALAAGTQNFDIVLMNNSTATISTVVSDSLDAALRSGEGDVDVGTVTANQYFLPVLSARALATGADGQPHATPIKGTGDTLPTVQWVRDNPPNYLPVISATVIGTNGSGAPLSTPTKGTGTSVVVANAVAGPGDTVPTVNWVRGQVDSIPYVFVRDSMRLGFVSNSSILTTLDGKVSGATGNTGDVFRMLGAGSSTFWTAASNNSSLFVISGNGTVFTAPATGSPWSSGTINSNQSMLYALWNGSYFLDIGTVGTIRKSVDGFSWDSVSSGVSNNLAGSCYDASNSRWVVVGSGPAVLTGSSDGLTWTSRTYGGANAVRGVDCGDTVYVSVGTTGVIKTSPTGVTWTTRTSGVSTELTKVAWNGTTHVAVGASGVILTSTNTVTWTARTSGVATALYDVYWDGSRFTAVGANGVIISSTNGTVWTGHTSGVVTDLYGVTKGSGLWLAVGALGARITSSDGDTWTPLVLLTPGFEPPVGTGSLVAQRGDKTLYDSIYFDGQAVGRNYFKAPKLAADDSVTIGADTKWYRSSANVMRTPDSMMVDGKITDKGYAGAARFAADFRVPFVYDDFSAVNQFLGGRLTPTGQNWSCTGPAGSTVRISNGLVVTDSNFYCWLPYPTALKRVAGNVSFVPGAGANDGSQKPNTIIAGQGTDLGTMLHLEVGPGSCALSKRVGGGSFDFIYNRTYLNRVEVDGTPKAVSLTISGDSVIVVCADGVPALVTDAAIGTTIIPTHGGFQILPGTDKYTGRWNSVELGYSKAREFVSLGGAATGKDLADLEGVVNGEGLLRSWTMSYTLTGAAGWYEIAQGSALTTFTLTGQLWMTATDATGGGTTNILFTDYLGQGPRLTMLQYSSYFNPITQIRQSHEAGSPFRYNLAVYKTRSDPATVTITLRGVLNPVSAPTVGAADYDVTKTVDLGGYGMQTTAPITAPRYDSEGSVGVSGTCSSVTVTNGIVTTCTP